MKDTTDKLNTTNTTDKKVNNAPIEEAWDNVEKKMVKACEVRRSHMHDRNRFFSKRCDYWTDDDNSGDVLTVHKESREITRKNGTKSFTRKAHFARIGKNTAKYREVTAKKQEKQYESIHDLCNEVILDIKFIHIPEVKATFNNTEFTLIPEQYAKIKRVDRINKVDKETGKIPDAVIIVDLLGVEQEVFIEFYYTHEVDENKRKFYTFYKKNCLQVDLYHLKADLNLTKEALKKKIKVEIEENLYWVTNRAQILFNGDAYQKYVLTIDKSNKLINTAKPENKDKESERFYFYRDLLPLDHRCYAPNSEGKVRVIGECKRCENCLMIENYYDLQSTNAIIHCVLTDIDTSLFFKIYDEMLRLLGEW